MNDRGVVHNDRMVAGTEGPQIQAPDGVVEKMLALGLEISKRAAELRCLDDLYFFLVNDVRSLIAFDRCFLITHLGGRSCFAAANNQPSLEPKSKLFGEMEALAQHLGSLDKGILLTNAARQEDFPAQGVSEEQKRALSTYLRSMQATYFLIVPLLHSGKPAGHLIFEFMDQAPPDQLRIIALLNMAPLFASVLVEKWLLNERPALARVLDPAPRTRTGPMQLVTGHPALALVGALLLAGILFLLPIDRTVGGEAIIAPWDRHLAFCRIDGLIEKVDVTEGSGVNKDATLANLDPTELTYKIESAERQAEILGKKMLLLRREADTSPSKLGDLKVVELERQKAIKDLQFLKWQSQFLEIKAPISGIVLTKDVESLAGKKMRAGETFCEILPPGDLAVEIYLPEDKVAFTKSGQHAYAYLNNNPLKGYEVTIGEIAPVAEALPRLGNVFRARAKFPDAPPDLKVGMKGVGKIQTGSTSLWSLIEEGVMSRWTRWSLYW